MSSTSRLPLFQSEIAASVRTLPGLRVDAPIWHEPSTRRDRIWDLSPNLHCSIVGTCLTTGGLRQLFAKLNEPDAKTASDHDIHSRAVRIAGQRDGAGKMLNRMLDKRHEQHIKRFADERARSVRLVERVGEINEALKAKELEFSQLEARLNGLSDEFASLEVAMAGLTAPPESAAEAAPSLDGQRLLYVGGRPKQIEQLRALTSRMGGTLLTHDGGIEDSMSLLPGLLGQADAAFFPVDCVSHGAAGQVKRICRDLDKPFVPLRNAGLASFVVAINGLRQIAAPRHG